jgi:hypothetical protein
MWKPLGGWSLTGLQSPENKRRILGMKEKICCFMVAR